LPTLQQRLQANLKASIAAFGPPMNIPISFASLKIVPISLSRLLAQLGPTATQKMNGKLVELYDNMEHVAQTKRLCCMPV
jgi:hypothetical protein